MNDCLPGRDHFWNPIALDRGTRNHSVVYLLCVACWQYAYKPVRFAGEYVPRETQDA